MTIRSWFLQNDPKQCQNLRFCVTHQISRSPSATIWRHTEPELLVSNFFEHTKCNFKLKIEIWNKKI